MSLSLCDLDTMTPLYVVNSLWCPSAKISSGVIVSRNTINGLTYAEIQNINRFDMIVNTTPVGMYPNVDASPLEESVVKKSDVVIDLIFNPKVTKLLSYSNEGYNGLVMLIYQAIYALRTWLNKDLDYDIDEIIKLIEEGA